jgi:hypothetical protein
MLISDNKNDTFQSAGQVLHSYVFCHNTYFSLFILADGLVRSIAFNTSVVVIVSKRTCKSPEK